jgi:hypothetical protein
LSFGPIPTRSPDRGEVEAIGTAFGKVPPWLNSQNATPRHEAGCRFPPPLAIFRAIKSGGSSSTGSNRVDSSPSTSRSADWCRPDGHLGSHLKRERARPCRQRASVSASTSGILQLARANSIESQPELPSQFRGRHHVIGDADSTEVVAPRASDLLAVALEDCKFQVEIEQLA